MTGFGIAMAVAIICSVLGDFFVKKSANRRRDFQSSGGRSEVGAETIKDGNRSPSHNGQHGLTGKEDRAPASGSARPTDPTSIRSSGSGSNFLTKMGRAVHRNLFMIIGLLFLTVHFIGLLSAMRFGPVSVVVPLMACTYVLTTLMGKFILHEKVTKLRWAGVGVIMCGVVALGISTAIPERPHENNPLVAAKSLPGEIKEMVSPATLHRLAHPDKKQVGQSVQGGLKQ